MASLQLVCICGIGGGLAADRRKEARECTGGPYGHIANYGAEEVLFLSERLDARVDIPWLKICTMT